MEEQDKNAGAEQQAQKRFYNEVPDYRAADELARADMDQYIEPFRYDDIECAMSFGLEAVEVATAAASDINESARMNQSLMGDLKQASEMMSNLSLDDVRATSERLVNGAYQIVKENKEEVVAAGVGAMFMGLPGAIAGLIGMKGYKKGVEVVGAIKERVSGEVDYEAEAQKLRTTLHHSSGEVEKIKTSLRKANQAIPASVAQINKLGRAQGEAFSNLAVAIGAGNEILKRYEEDVLPAAKDEVERESLMTCYEMMGQQVEHLVASRALRLTTGITLEKTKRMYGDAAVKIRHHLTNSTAEWDTQIASGHLIADQYDVQKTISKADKKSIELLESQQKMHEALKQMSQKSLSQGTHNLGELLRITNQVIEGLDSDKQKIDGIREQRRQQLEQLGAATDRLQVKFKEHVAGRNQALLEAPQEATALPAPEQDNKLGVAKVRGPSPL